MNSVNRNFELWTKFSTLHFDLLMCPSRVPRVSPICSSMSTKGPRKAKVTKIVDTCVGVFDSVHIRHLSATDT